MADYIKKAEKAARAAIMPHLAARVLGSRVSNAWAFRKLVFNLEFGICYNRIRKNANSTTVVLMDNLSGKSLGVEESKKTIAKIGTLNLRTVRRLSKFRYFVVTRSPYSRTLSAFLQKFPTEKTKKRCGEFSIDPEGFRAFVRWLDNGGITKDSHWDFQQKQMCFGLSGYDAVVRIENYNAEMRAFLLRCGVPESKIDIQGSTNSGRFHQTKASDKLRLFYDSETTSIVRRCYESDFSELGYDPEQLA